MHEGEFTAGAAPLPRINAAWSWRLSWPLLAAAFAYVYALSLGTQMFLDGDTYWHIATGQWIFAHGGVPKVDPFSHTMAGTPWVAHEWLSEVVLAGAYDAGGWALVQAVTAGTFALAVALLTRALLGWLEPIYALLFAGLGVAMTSGHLLARPHIIALPLMMLWTIELVRASEGRRAPAWWMLPVMCAWANLHGGFTLGIALAGALAMEAVIEAPRAQRIATAKAWGLFLVLAVASALLTPHGIGGLLYTYHVLNLGFVLERVGEWRSPDFHTFNTFELWIIGAFALAFWQGLRLPAMRLVLFVGLMHLALKHVRYVELVGLLAPLFIAKPLAQQWRQRRESQPQASALDRLFLKLAQPAGLPAVLVCACVVALGSMVAARMKPIELPAHVAPRAALDAVAKAGVHGHVLNSYYSGGWLVYSGVPVFIDGRADMYGEKFTREYIEALELRSPGGFEALLAKYDISWTLLDKESSCVALLDHLPGWRRLYADGDTVVHVRTNANGS